MNARRRVLSLFSGIEGFGLGLESTGGFEVTHAVELADYPRAVIAKRYPHVDLAVDVREVSGPVPVEAMAFGFPCQDLSGAGRGAGLDGARSGLWSEGARIIGEVEPQLVFVENVPLLLSRGFDRVLADLTALGYVVEWDCLPAAAFGAWHLRDRVWIVAHKLGYPCVFGEPTGEVCVAPRATATEWRKWPRAGFAAHAEGCIPLEPLAPLREVKRGRLLWPSPRAAQGGAGGQRRGYFYSLGAAVNDPEHPLFPTPAASSYGSNRGGAAGRVGPVRHSLESMARHGLWPTPRASNSSGEHTTYRRTPSQRAGKHGLYLQSEVVEAELEAGRIDEEGIERLRRSHGALNPEWVEWLMGFPIGWTDLDAEPVWHPWAVEPDIARVTDRAERRRDRLTALGNALVPPAAAWLGERALEAIAADAEAVAA